MPQLIVTMRGETEHDRGDGFDALLAMCGGGYSCPTSDEGR